MNLSAFAIRCARVTPRRIHVLLPVGIMAVLWALSSLPGTPLPGAPALYTLFYWISPSLQNLLHIPAYAALGWAWRWALAAWLRMPGPLTLVAGVITFAYGIFDEFHQSFVPGRYASLTDVALDLVGASLGVALAAAMSRYAAGANARVRR